MALRRRLDGVADIRISQEQQTADVSFGPGSHAFAAAEFRAAVGEAEVGVLSFEIDACGKVDRDGDGLWFTAGPNRFRLEASPGAVPPGEACLTGILTDSTSPPRLERVRAMTSRGRGPESH